MLIIRLRRLIGINGRSDLSTVMGKATTTSDLPPPSDSERLWRLFHEVWGDSKELKYDKRKWEQLQEMIQNLEKKGGDKT